MSNKWLLRKAHHGPYDTQGASIVGPNTDVVEVVPKARVAELETEAKLLREGLKERMDTAVGTPQETSAKLDWMLHCYGELELKYYALKRQLAGE